MDASIVFDNLDLLFEGLLLTIQLMVTALVLGSILAVPLAVAASSKNFLTSALPRAFIYFFRGTPLLVQAFLIYNGSGQFEWLRESFLWPFFRSAYNCALLAITLNAAAYIAEIVRGAIAQTPYGEVEAAKASGMSAWLRFRRIVLPSALIRALPAYGNEMIFLLHGTAIAGLITVVELFGASMKINSKYYAPFEAFIAAGLIYLMLTYLLIGLVKQLEKKWYAHLRPRETSALDKNGADGMDLKPG